MAHPVELTVGKLFCFAILLVSVFNFFFQVSFLFHGCKELLAFAAFFAFGMRKNDLLLFSIELFII